MTKDEQQQRKKRQRHNCTKRIYHPSNLVVQVDASDLAKDEALFPYERYFDGLYYVTYPEIASIAALRVPTDLPIPLVDEVVASVLFTWVPEDVFVQINPMAAGYRRGTFNDMTDQHCRILDVFYSDQSQLQYVYNIFKYNDVVNFSLVVAHFEDSCADDRRDPNRTRFLEYLHDPNNWNTIMELELGYGYVVFDFKNPVRPIENSEILQERLQGIGHITAHVNRYLERENFERIFTW